MWIFIFYLSHAVSTLFGSYNSEALAIQVSSEDTYLKRENGIWYYSQTKFSGYVIEMQKNVPITKIPVLNGMENGLVRGWYSSGEKKFEGNYRNGKRTGVHKGWHQNGVLAYEFYFQNDLYEGEQLTYFDNGQLWQQLHYVNGYEEGKQKTWSKTGRVINNFTVKNGKLYGVIGRYDCMSVMAEK